MKNATQKFLDYIIGNSTSAEGKQLPEVQTFTFENGSDTNEVRTLLIDSEPWWVLKDVCKVLEIKDSHIAARKLDDDERYLIPLIDRMGREQKTTIINQSGLYTLILRSDKPQAKPFRKWVTSEVIPSVMKTGKYEVKPEIKEEPEPKPVSEQPIGRYYPEKATSIGEIVNLIKILREIMKAQGSSSVDIARVTEKLCEQFGIKLHYSFVNIRGLTKSLEDIMSEKM